MAKGDHIFVQRALYSHHGIDCGDGTVIHYTGEPGQKRNAAVKRTDIHEFTAGGNLMIRYYSKHDSADKTLERAFSRLGEDSYNLFFNNCEHFATWCKTGKKNSEQVVRAADAVVDIFEQTYISSESSSSSVKAVAKIGVEIYKTMRKCQQLPEIESVPSKYRKKIKVISNPERTKHSSQDDIKQDSLYEALELIVDHKNKFPSR
ncbi:lecithin retinol acyltransferase family protein [Desulfonatronovibrio magnus]|uniref:lecithin retinol acyltransferase family protein n=1 Tax=Desulfonatronovibrio magnus TaxID=698827 RepID=UPI0006970668|nr:lecithin retinol acyltransferase family protein [Desulfonatronovibrio magnus]